MPRRKKRNTCTPLKTSLEHDLIEFKSFRVLFKDFSVFVFFVGGIYILTFIIYSLEESFYFNFCWVCGVCIGFGVVGLRVPISLFTVHCSL